MTATLRHNIGMKNWIDFHVERTALSTYISNWNLKKTTHCDWIIIYRHRRWWLKHSLFDSIERAKKQNENQSIYAYVSSCNISSFASSSYWIGLVWMASIMVFFFVYVCANFIGVPSTKLRLRQTINYKPNQKKKVTPSEMGCAWHIDDFMKRRRRWGKNCLRMRVLFNIY